MRNWYAFEGRSGEVIHNAPYFFAWYGIPPMGTYSTLKEAMDSIGWGEEGYAD